MTVENFFDTVNVAASLITVENVFDTINVAASLIVFGILFYKLAAMPEKFTWVERVGMGLTGAGAMLLIAPITFKPSPFDGWALSLFLVGNAVYFVGRMTRHRLNNSLQRRDALRRFEERR
jgi:hypothetical protein